MSEWMATTRGFVRCVDVEEVFVEYDKSRKPGQSSWAIAAVLRGRNGDGLVVSWESTEQEARQTLRWIVDGIESHA